MRYYYQPGESKEPQEPETLYLENERLEVVLKGPADEVIIAYWILMKEEANIWPFSSKTLLAIKERLLMSPYLRSSKFFAVRDLNHVIIYPKRNDENIRSKIVS